MLTRRHALMLGAAGLLAPRRLSAERIREVDHQFLFVVCSGGWDITKVFAPKFDSPNVDMGENDTVAEVDGVTFCDSGVRPSVRRFFERWGDRSCIVNGIEVRSISHTRCNQLMMTGSGQPGRDDWAALLAGRSVRSWLTPHLVLGGTSYAARYADKVVRVGRNGQLPGLLDGSALAERSTTKLRLPSAATRARTDAFLQARLAGFDATADPGGADFAARYLAAAQDVEALAARAEGMDLSAPPYECQLDTVAECSVALDCFEARLARCALVEQLGVCQVGWDTHGYDGQQSGNFELLFSQLDEVMTDLAARGPKDAPLHERVTLVVLSEMGRAPRLNAGGGRDHWTYTSALLVGGGIRGGQVIGGVDDDLLGERVDLASGSVHDSGTLLLPGHLGATLLAIGGVDPAEAGIAEEPISAAIA